MSISDRRAAGGDGGFRHLFGPVPSRRLGMSLGVDLIPHKTCSMDCIYCESGATTILTAERSEFHPLGQILAELDRFLNNKPELDYITFSGAGEPTLYSRIGEIIAHLKKKHPEYKIALLTNASMLVDKKVSEAVKNVDLIVPSLDAATPGIFKRLNRPVSSADCHGIIQALADFRNISSAQFWLEIFIVPGLNDSRYSLDKLAAAARKIKPDKIQLNTLDRPGTESWVSPASAEQMRHAAEFFADSADTEIIGEVRQANGTGKSKTPKDLPDRARIIALLRRRPCTERDIRRSLECTRSLLSPVLSDMLRQGLIASEKGSRGVFFKTI